MTLEDLQTQIDTLREDYFNTCNRVHRLEEWVDTFSSPLYKRVVFWLRGWRWRTLGRWRGADRSQWPGPAEKWWR